jgi:signal peptidase I
MGPQPSQAPKKGPARARRRFGVIAVLAAGAVWLLWCGVSYGIPNRVYLIPSASMAPLIKPGDRVGVSTIGSIPPKRGEIWVFRMPPASGNMPNEAVKRIIGLPGERVEVKDGSVYIDGSEYREPYLTTPIGYSMPALKLGRDEYFVLGESRGNSHDSHVWGPLHRDYLIGPVKVRFWPPQRIGGL